MPTVIDVQDLAQKVAEIIATVKPNGEAPRFAVLLVFPTIKAAIATAGLILIDVVFWAFLVYLMVCFFTRTWTPHNFFLDEDEETLPDNQVASKDTLCIAVVSDAHQNVDNLRGRTPQLCNATVV
mmetsp:Transcript_25704/g.52643  ORF Transcript_25704/g.52643 Transcript_25704/m.52643 type:complete len:125 (-) Transcript_25704:251-625(-)